MIFSREKVNYIDGKPENGILYDYRKINKVYKSLCCPKEYYNPTTAPITKASWFVEVSQRSTGKTTNWILYGLVMFWLYGTVTHYVRGTENEIAPKVSKELFSVIISSGYIDKLTDGEYNNMYYKSRKWYLCHVNDDSEIDKICPEHCLYMCCVDKGGNLKSSHNAPKGDLIIYDEFISLVYKYRCDFVPFCDLCKTIFRDRLSGKIVLLANTIDKMHQYFHELEIYERISEMDISDNCIHTTDKGTNIYIEIIGTPTVLKKAKTKFNKLFLGFKNTELSGITGETTWSIKNFPHIPECEYKSLARNIYISHNNKLVSIEIVQNDLGVCIYCHWASKKYSDSIVLISKSITNPNEHFGLADDTKLYKIIMNIINHKKIYFASNDVGNFVQNYLKECNINIDFC